jgi:hypothetical protein
MLAGESGAWFGGSAVGARELIAPDLPALEAIERASGGWQDAQDRERGERIQTRNHQNLLVK